MFFTNDVQCIPHFSVILVRQQDLFLESQTTKCILSLILIINFPTTQYFGVYLLFPFKTFIVPNYDF